MANTDAAFGLKPHGNVLRANIYALATSYGTAVYHGCMMETDGASFNTFWSGGTSGCQVEETGAGGSILGAVVGIFNSDMDPIKYLPASTAGDGVVAGYVSIADHPYQQFIAQEDGDTTPIAAANIGQNCDMIGTGGSTKTGVSTQEIDSTTVNTTATLALKLLGVYKNDIVATAYCRHIVMINSHHHGSNIAGI